jgi:inhibitor of cysteine peptidase
MKNKNKKFAYIFATCIVSIIIIVSIAVPLINNKKNKVNDPTEIITEEGGLPKIENFKNLYNILKTNTTESNNTNELTSDTTKSSSTQEAVTLDDYSKTNVQVEGVDEADIVKTDGEYIYYVGANKITIVDSKDASKLNIISEIKYDNNFEFYPNEIYIKENKLIVIGQTYETNEEQSNENNTNCCIPSSNYYTASLIYNLEDKSKPVLERKVELEGTYLSSRMIDNNVYIISNKNMYSYIFTKEKIEDINENDYKTKYIDTAVSNDKKCLDYNNMYYFPESQDTTCLNIAGFNITNNEEADITSYLGAGNEIYSSENNLYITDTKYEYKDINLYGYYNRYDIKTYIYKFKLDESKITYQAMGNVPGSILNQFSMDENDGYFRIATTNSNGNTTENNLYVLNDKLELIGKIENLAKDEQIYSVRFIENRAYVVTFVQTDPLFVIDLTDPTNPTVLGELRIPGYSTYLQPYDENHIIGFGQDTKTDDGNVVKINGIKMGLFDVSDPTNPVEMFSTKIGTIGTYSELLYNHKALLFSKEKNILAFPITISENTSDYKNNLKFQGAMIYNIDLENGFILKGTISHIKSEDGYIDYDETKEVERIIYINNNLFTLSKSLIKAISLDTMDEVGSVEIPVDKVSKKEVIY